MTLQVYVCVQVCQRDGVLCLMFRVGDRRRAHIVGTKVRAYLMETRNTSQGEYLENFQTPLKLEPHGLLLWPLTIVHKITPTSPLYDMSARDLLLKKYVHTHTLGMYVVTSPKILMKFVK